MNPRVRLLVPFQVLVVVAIPVLLLLSNLLWAVSEVRLYEYGFRKYHVSKVTGIEDGELSRAAAGLVRYFDSREDTIEVSVMRDGRPVELFNDREKVHLRDVKGLIQFGRRLRLGLLFYLLFFVVTSRWLRGKDFCRTLAVDGLYGSGLTLVFMLVFGLFALLGFEQLFLQFHLLSFSNDFWMLDPTRDYLIMMFPYGFFNEATLFIAIATLAEDLFLGFICWLYLKRVPRDSRSQERQ